jgi:hypothetical protein
LYWNPTKIHDQLTELVEVEAAVIKMRKSLAKKYGVMSYYDIPVFLAGDFNNGPASPIYAYMAHRFGVPNSNINSDSTVTSSTTTQVSLPNSSMRSAHSLYSLAALPSSSSSSISTNGDSSNSEKRSSANIESIIRGGLLEPVSTAVNYKRSWTIDYIFHSSDALAGVTPSPILSAAASIVAPTPSVSPSLRHDSDSHHKADHKKEHKHIEPEEDDDGRLSSCNLRLSLGAACHLMICSQHLCVLSRDKTEDNFGGMDDNGEPIVASRSSTEQVGPWWVWPAFVLELPNEIDVKTEDGPIGWAERENIAITKRYLFHSCHF